MKKIVLLIITLFLTAHTFSQNGSEDFELSKIKLENDDHKGAIIDLTNAIDKEKYPSLLGTYYFFRGNSKNMLKDYRGAILDFTKSIETFKDYILSIKNINPTTYTVMAIAYSKRAYSKIGLNNLNEAILDVNEAIVLNPKDGDFYILRGEIKFLLGQKDSACLDFSRAGELGANGAYERITGNCN